MGIRMNIKIWNSKDQMMQRKASLKKKRLEQVFFGHLCPLQDNCVLLSYGYSKLKINQDHFTVNCTRSDSKYTLMLSEHYQNMCINHTISLEVLIQKELLKRM